MSLEEFFVEEVGLSRECWRGNGREFREALEEALCRYRGGSSFFGPPSDDGFLELIDKGPDYLGFFACELVGSDLEDKSLVLERVTEFAFRRPELESYPAVGVFEFLSGERGVRRRYLDWLLAWVDPFSSFQSFESVFGTVMEGDFDSSVKAAVFLMMVDSLKKRKMDRRAKKLTGRFFGSGRISEGFKREFARVLAGKQFAFRVKTLPLADLSLLSGPDRVVRLQEEIDLIPDSEVLSRVAEVEGVRLMMREGAEHSVERERGLEGEEAEELGRYIKSVIGGEWIRRYFESEVAGRVGRHLALRTAPRLQFHFEKRLVTGWLLDSLADEEVKSFIRGRLGKDYHRRDFPTMRGIFDYLREWGKSHPEFTRGVLDELKGANRCQIRREAFDVAYAIFEDEEYLDEARNDDAEKVREWGEEMSSRGAE